ncbi:hypothetical protein [Polaromonas sp. CG9_12]|nr:hypothetical protein [Polaromonas sp. CG9_12]
MLPVVAGTAGNGSPDRSAFVKGRKAESNYDQLQADKKGA